MQPSWWRRQVSYCWNGELGLRRHEFLELEFADNELADDLQPTSSASASGAIPHCSTGNTLQRRHAGTCPGRGTWDGLGEHNLQGVSLLG